MNLSKLIARNIETDELVEIVDYYYQSPDDRNELDRVRYIDSKGFNDDNKLHYKLDFQEIGVINPNHEFSNGILSDSQLRLLVSGMILQGMLSNPDLFNIYNEISQEKEMEVEDAMAIDSITHADALIEQLNNDKDE